MESPRPLRPRPRPTPQILDGWHGPLTPPPRAPAPDPLLFPHEHARASPRQPAPSDEQAPQRPEATMTPTRRVDFRNSLQLNPFPIPLTHCSTIAIQCNSTPFQLRTSGNRFSRNGPLPYLETKKHNPKCAETQLNSPPPHPPLPCVGAPHPRRSCEGRNPDKRDTVRPKPVEGGALLVVPAKAGTQGYREGCRCICIITRSR